MKKSHKILIGIGILALLGAIFGDNDKPISNTAAETVITSTPISTPVPTLTPEQIAENEKQAKKRKIELQFSSWDGSHHKLTKYIKSTMNDPDSYKHVETVYGIYDTYLIVFTTFRGKNSFGGVVTNTIKAKIKNIDGEIIEILKQ